MHHVLETPSEYWNNANLEKCFVDPLRRLLLGLQKNSITDVFFPSVTSTDLSSSFQVNMLDRIKVPQVKRQIGAWLEGVINKYDRTGQVMDIFK